MIDKKIKTRAFWLILCGILIVSFFLYQRYKTKDNSNTITLGVLAPLTGEYSRYGQAMQWGLDLAVEEINSNNDALRINLLYQDDKFTAKDAIDGFNYFKQKDIPLIFGPAGSGISKLLAPMANKAQIVLLSSISTADSLKYA